MLFADLISFDHVTRFDGSPLFTAGIPPTIPVERTRTGVAAGRDELLEIAFELSGGTDLEVSALDVDTSRFDRFVRQVDDLLPDSWTQFDDGNWQLTDNETHYRNTPHFDQL